MQQIKLSEYAKRMGVTYRTAQNWYYDGKIPNAYKLNKRIYVKLVANEVEDNCVAIYARVSSHDQKDDLKRQIERLQLYCASKGYIIKSQYSEIASGINDNRKKLNDLLNNPEISKIVIENKDRLTRFGYNYLTTLLKRLNVQIETINESKDEQKNLINDFVSIITSFCVKIYGKRSGKHKANKIVEQL